MWQRASAAQRWALAVGIGALVLVAIDVWWFMTYRDGYPLNVDEAGYTTIGLVDYLGWQSGGLSGWWEAVQNQTPNAPLLPAITSILLLFKPGIMAGFATLTGFVVVLAFAVYGIGEKLAGPRLGALAALISATLPGTFLFSREYVFALPTAAMLAGAVCALVRSDAMRLRRWAIACGAALGLMLLARTMAVAFVPGVLVAAVLLILVHGRDDLRNRLINLGLLVLTGAAVAALWYWRNLQPVLDYLTSYGYGNQSQYYGDEASLLSWERLSTVAKRMTFTDLLVPVAALLFVGLLALGFVAIKRVRDSEDRRAALLQLAGSNALAVLIVFATGYAALTSSQNGGNGFTYPIAVLLPPLAVLALRYFRVAVIPVLALVAAITLVNLAAYSTLWDDLSKPRSVNVPAFGYLPWIGGIPQTVGAIRVQAPGPESHFEERERDWMRTDEKLADLFMEPLGPGGTEPLVTFASRNRVISSNSVQLAALLRAHRTIPMTQIIAEPTDSVANYKRQLGPDFGSPSVLVTMSRNTEDYPPVVTQSRAEQAAQEFGFRKIRTFDLPDGRQVYVWQKGAPAPAPASSAPSRPTEPASAPGNRRG